MRVLFSVSHTCLAAAAAALLSACAHNPPVNEGLVLRQPLTDRENYSFRSWMEARGDIGPDLVILTFSGGGSRAATLAVGVLDALSGDLKHVGLISSTSGGSVTAAAFAAEGPEGINTVRERFLKRDNMKALVPKLLPLVVIPGSNRATRFAEYLEQQLFNGEQKKYSDFIDIWPNAPFVVLNSTDMSSARTFEFTQESFYSLCSNMAGMRVAHAMAASAAFPFLMNPVPLRNHWDQKECGQVLGDWSKPMVDSAQDTRYLYPENVARARHIHSLQHTYDGGPADRKIEYVHLLDGGLSDNLAARAVVRILGTHMDDLRARKVERILLVQVNARSVSKDDYSRSPSVPSLLDTFWAVTLNPIDIATELSSYLSSIYLVQLVRAVKAEPPSTTKKEVAIYPVAVDFNLLPDVPRRRAQGIGTSWSLEAGELEFLESIGHALVKENPCYRAFRPAPGGGEEPDCQYIRMTASAQAMVPPGDRIASAFPVARPAPPPAPGVSPAPPPAALPSPPPPPPPQPPAATKVTYAADAFFDFDKWALKPEGRAKLDDLASKIQGVSLEVIIAVGHTDAAGTDAYNQRLSVRRAEAVKAYLVSKGIERNRVYTEGRGERQPVADNKTADGRAKNRRVEIEVVGVRVSR